MRLGYYFWNNYQKTGYTHGKLIKDLYKKEVIDGRKSSSVFMKEQTESVMETERKKTGFQIDALNLKIENSKNNKENLQKEKETKKKRNNGKISR